MKTFTIKTIAVILSIFILAQSALPGFAQTYKAPLYEPHFFINKEELLDSEKLSINAEFFKIGNTLSFEKYKAALSSDKDLVSLRKLSQTQWEELYFAYKKAVVEQEAQVTSAYNHIKKNYKYGPEDALRAAKINKNNKICDNGKCFDPVIYNRALLRALLRYGAGVDETNKKWRWNGEIMLNSAKDIYNILSKYGINEGDLSFAQKYFRYLLEKTGSYCGNDLHMADIMPGLTGRSGAADAKIAKEARFKSCERLGYIALSLPLLEELSSNDKTQNAEIIYQQLKSNYKKDYGALVLGNYVTALLMIGNNKAYRRLEDFLLSDSLKDGLRVGGVWQILGRVLDILSIKAWVDATTEATNKIRGRGGRYLNEVGLKFQYVDEDTAKSYGYSAVSVSMAKDGYKGYNIPYGNILEDIGVLLSQWPDKRAQAIVNKAVNNYVSALRNNFSGYSSVHIPLVTGAIKGGGVKGRNVKYAVDKLYALDWWDLNEGTQRRVNNIMAKASKKYGFGNKPLKTKDNIKKSRADKNQRIAQLAVWGDILVGAIFISSLALSLPSLARGMSSFVKTFQTSKAARSARINTIRKAGKADLLKKTSSNIKRGGTAPRKGSSGKTAKKAPADNNKASAAKNNAKSEDLASVVKKRKEAEVGTASQNGAENAGKKSPISSSLQTPIEEKTVRLFPYTEKNSPTFTATVGEGGGGASAGAGAGADAAFTKRAKKLLIAQKEAETDWLLKEEALDILRKVDSAPFKPGWFFNKPYKELPKWKQFVADRYFSWNMYWDINRQIAKGVLNNPGKAFSGLTLTGAPGVNLFTPKVVFAPLSQGPQTVLKTAYNLSNTFGTSFNIAKVTPTLTSVEVLANTSKTAASAANALQKGAAGTKQIFSVFALPKIEGVLNEFHGGPSAGGTIKRLSSNILSVPSDSWLGKTGYIKERYKDIDLAETITLGESLEGKAEGFSDFELFASKMLKRQPSLKEKTRLYDDFLAVSKYLSPRLTAKLLDIINQKSYGVQNFEILFNQITKTIPYLKKGQLITLSGYKINFAARNKPLEEDEAVKFLVIGNDPLWEVFDYVCSPGNFMIKSALEKARFLSDSEQKKVLKDLINIQLYLQETDPTKRLSYIFVANGENYEWEDFSKTEKLDFQLGKEIRKHLYQDINLEKKKIDYIGMLLKYRKWLTTVLEATPQTPALWFENPEGTYFIYSYDGEKRIRIGSHEFSSGKGTNYHLHLEYRLKVHNDWVGPVKYTYYWINQSILPMQAFRDMVEAPIAYMESQGVLINRADFMDRFGVGTKESQNDEPEETLSDKGENTYARYLSSKKNSSDGKSAAKEEENDEEDEDNISLLVDISAYDKALIPKMTTIGLTLTPEAPSERRAFRRDIINEVNNLFGGKYFLPEVRRNLASRDLSSYKRNVFVAEHRIKTGQVVKGTAFISEYLGMKFFLTNRHVVGNSDWIMLTDNKGNVFLADVIARTPLISGLDLALLLPRDKSVLESYTPLKLSIGPSLQTGDDLYSIGYPGHSRTVQNKAFVMVDMDKSSVYPLINIYPSTMHGESGSPLLRPLNEEGGDKVVGMASLSNTINSLFISSKTIKRFVKNSIKIGLSDPNFDNKIFYDAGLFKGYDKFKKRFLLDGDLIWRVNLISTDMLLKKINKRALVDVNFDKINVDNTFVPVIFLDRTNKIPSNEGNNISGKDDISDGK